MKNKIVILCNSSNGLYRFRKELIEKLKNKSNVFIITPYNDNEIIKKLKKLGCKLIESSINRKGRNIFEELKLIIFYFKTLKRIKPDKVLTYTIKPNIYGGIVCQLLKIDYISTITGIGSAFQKEGILKKTVIFLNKIALKNAKKIFFQNETNLRTYLDNKIIKLEKTKLVNGSGVNLERFNSDIKKLNFPKQILFIGRIMKEKGIEEFIEVAKRIKENYKEKVEFSILGPYEEHEYTDIIESLQNQGIIKYLGTSNDVRKELNEVHCLVNPSWHEGMSNVLLEAGAMKRFLIASDIPGCKEIVVNNKTGFTFEKQNIDDLEDKIERFMKLSDEEYQKYIERSYNHIKSNFSREKVVEEYLNILNQ